MPGGTRRHRGDPLQHVRTTGKDGRWCPDIQSPLTGHKNLRSPCLTWQHALGVSSSRLETYSTGSTSLGRAAFSNALFNASMCRIGYAELAERKPDWIIACLDGMIAMRFPPVGNSL